MKLLVWLFLICVVAFLGFQIYSLVQDIKKRKARKNLENNKKE